MTTRGLGKLILAAFGLAVFLGCAEEKLTFDRWQTIHDGQSPEAVTQCLGDPWHKLSDRWIYEDTDRHISARVYFNEDGTKVICKQWYDPDNGWHGKNPDEVQGNRTGNGGASSTSSGTID
jgi:hypothetical protein